MREFLSFRKMVTPILIQVFFWIGVVGTVVGGLGLIIGGQGFGGLLLLLLGPLFVRVYCEILILFFRMNETLTEIKNNTQRQ